MKIKLLALFSILAVMSVNAKYTQSRLTLNDYNEIKARLEKAIKNYDYLFLIEQILSPYQEMDLTNRDKQELDRLEKFYYKKARAYGNERRLMESYK